MISSVQAYPWPYHLSIIIPCLNEEKNISQVILDSDKYCSKRFPGWEIIIIDDGSTDATASLVEDLAGSDGRIKLVKHEENSGYGQALRTGIQHIAGDTVFITDGDYQYRIEELDRFLPRLKTHDLVIGRRRKRDEGVSRRFLSFVYRLFLKMTLGLSFADANCSFKLTSAQFLKNIPLSSQGFAIDAEILYRAQQRGFHICELPVRHYTRPGGISSVSLKNIRQTIDEVQAIRTGSS